ncbi:hypothetical protein HYT01_00345 [Candidatus Giovannonibacteria bacterium]|nr:hypothetical protein [Candidatus Giovannonibacteria bacterium]
MRNKAIHDKVLLSKLDKMSNLKGKRVLIFQQRSWGKGVGRFLAKKLFDEGCELAALTFKETTHDLIVNQPDVKYHHILFGDGILRDPRAYLAGDVYSLEEICSELGVDSIWPFVYSMRLYTKSYGDKYYFGYKKNVSDERMIEYIQAVYKCIKFFFDGFKADLVICPNFVSLMHIMFNLYGRKHNVPVLASTDSKVQGFYIFVEGYQCDRGIFFDRVNFLNDRRKETPNRARARQYINEFRDNFKTPTYIKISDNKTFFQKIRAELGPYKQILRWYIKRPKDMLKLGPTYEYKPPKIILRDHFCEKSYKKFMNRFSYYPLEAVKRYAYLPLQFQPEETIDVRAPYFSNQIETARLVAQSLPDDYTLVVKEHPVMIGKRSPSYIEKVARTVNVKFIDYRIASEKVLKGSSVVISPSSTSIAEAAFLKIPAIQLGDLGTSLKLPNVTHHTDLTTLSAKIKEVLSKNLNTDEYERKLENYVAAVFDTGFDYDKITKEWAGEGKSLLWGAYKTEIERILS